MEELDKYFSGELDPKIQYANIESGIKAHAEDYSFNIESELFNQLTKEQQTLWRKEIEQAVISGGEVGIELAKDRRYKENLEVKEVDLKLLYREYINNTYSEEFARSILDGNIKGDLDNSDLFGIMSYGFELGLKAAQKGE